MPDEIELGELTVSLKFRPGKNVWPLLCQQVTEQVNSQVISANGSAGTSSTSKRLYANRLVDALQDQRWHKCEKLEEELSTTYRAIRRQVSNNPSVFTLEETGKSPRDFKVKLTNAT
jgi:hypothetical protein